MKSDYLDFQEYVYVTYSLKKLMEEVKQEELKTILLETIGKTSKKQSELFEKI